MSYLRWLLFRNRHWRRSAFVDSRAVVHPTVGLGENVKIKAGPQPNRFPKLGRKVFVNDGSNIWGDVTIGEGTRIAPYCFIRDCDHDTTDTNLFVTTFKPVKIGKFCEIDAGATVRKGVTIGDHARVMSGAVVTTDVPDYGVVSGNHAKLVGYWRKRK